MSGTRTRPIARPIRELWMQAIERLKTIRHSRLPIRHPPANGRTPSAIFATRFLIILSAFGLSPTVAAQVSGDRASAIRGVVVTRGPAELVTYRWDFSRAMDANFDSRPDGWERRSGPRYPAYVDVKIRPIDDRWSEIADRIDTRVLLGWPKARRWAPWLPPVAPSLADQTVSRCLEIELDGGLAMMTSPPVPCRPEYRYRLKTRIQTVDLRHDTARVELRFLDAAGKTIGVTAGPAVGGDQVRDVVLSPVVPPAGTTSMQLVLRVQGGAEGREDVRGRIRFFPVVVGQYPQLKLSTSDPLAIHAAGQPVTATIQLVGGVNGPTTVSLRLTDQYDRQIVARRQELTAGGAPIDWSLGVLPAGWYQMAASIAGRGGVSLATETGFAVVEDLDRLRRDRTLRSRGWLPSKPYSGARDPQSDPATLVSVADGVATREIGGADSGFGVSLPGEMVDSLFAGRLTAPRIARWVVDSGAASAKIPVWLAASDDAGRRMAADLAIELRDRGIEPVGLLDRPPLPDIASYQSAGESGGGIAVWLADPPRWEPLMTETFHRLGPSIRRWQIGADNDPSHVSGFQTGRTLEQIATIIRGFGPRITLATPWSWLEPVPTDRPEGGVWQVLHRFSGEPLTRAETLARLRSVQSPPETPAAGPEFATWLGIASIDRRRYQADDRAIDLIGRMAATRHHGNVVAFATSMTDPATGLMTAELRPTPLWTVWRTAATLLAGTRWDGSLPLPAGSRGDLYAGSQWSVAVVSSDRPAVQRLHLGGRVVAVDPWGRVEEVPTEIDNGRQVHRFVTGPVPTFLVGVDLDLAAFRRSVRIDRQRLDVIAGQSQRFDVLFENPTARPITGQIAVLTPSTWRRDRQPGDWSITAGGVVQHPVTVTLAGDATVGLIDLPIYIRFDRPAAGADIDPAETAAANTIRVDRPLEVGPKGFDLLVTTRLVGEVMRVTLRVTNRTDRDATFDALMFAGTGRQYQRQVIAAGPGQTTESVFAWPGGNSLVDQTMTLRAIQREDRRVVNQIFPATR